MSEESLGGADDSMGMSLDLQGSITAVARDIERMRQPMKLFRSMAQFTLCFLRYTIVAIGANQWSWCCTIAHMDMINSIAERERARYGDVAIFVALCYDERRRKQWAERCKRNDSSLTTVGDLEKECSVENQFVLEECRMKVWIRMERSGLSSQASKARSELAGGYDGAGSSSAAKEDAAVDAFTKRANETARMMAKQQQDFLAKQAAMLHTDPTDHGQPKGGTKGKGKSKDKGKSGKGEGTRREAKRQAFLERTIADTQSRKDDEQYGGAGDGYKSGWGSWPNKKWRCPSFLCHGQRTNVLPHL